MGNLAPSSAARRQHTHRRQLLLISGIAWKTDEEREYLMIVSSASLATDTVNESNEKWCHQMMMTGNHHMSCLGDTIVCVRPQSNSTRIG